VPGGVFPLARCSDSPVARCPVACFRLLGAAIRLWLGARWRVSARSVLLGAARAGSWVPGVYIGGVMLFGLIRCVDPHSCHLVSFSVNPPSAFAHSHTRACASEPVDRRERCAWVHGAEGRPIVFDAHFGGP
jgi:hypothetical protein